jgi:hypothetical protein
VAPLIMDAATAPGVLGGTFANFSDVAVNGSDRYAFGGTAQLPSNGGSRVGLWSNGMTGSLQLVAIQCGLAPQLAGKTLTDFPTFSLSDSGLTAFTADVSPADRPGQQALYMQDALGNLGLGVCEGKPFEILPGQFATVKDIVFNNSFYDPETQAFSGNTLAFWLQFDDGRTGLYKATVGIPGDSDFSGIVDMGDYTLWFSNYGKTTGIRPEDGDSNGDGIVDMLDYTIWFSHYAQGGSQGQPVPEPGIAFLLVIGQLAAIARRRRG